MRCGSPRSSSRWTGCCRWPCRRRRRARRRCRSGRRPRRRAGDGCPGGRATGGRRARVRAGAVNEQRRNDRADREQRGEQQDQRPRRDAAAPAAAGPRALRPHSRRDLRAMRFGEARVELLAEVDHRREAVGGVLRHRTVNRGLEPRRDIGALVADRRRLLVDVAHRDGDEVLARERHLVREQLVENDAERVDVRLLVHPLPLRLLGRDVVGCAEHRARLRHPVLHVERARDPEVGDLRLALAVQEDVLRLHVAVDEALLVRERERARDLDRRARARS